MGLTVKNKNNYDLSDDVSNFFSIPVDIEVTTTQKEQYSDLKSKIYTLDLDSEEKANILNKINQLNTNISYKEEKDIIKEIEDFKDKYNL